MNMHVKFSQFNKNGIPAITTGFASIDWADQPQHSKEKWATNRL